MKKVVLVTGGAGYIGSQTVKEMLNNDIDVIVFDNLSTGNQKAVDTRAKFILGDLASKEDFDKVFKENKIDGVLHCAGKIVVSESVDKPFEYFDANIKELQNVLEVVANNNVKNFMFSSTASIYGDNAAKHPATELTAPSPVNPYADTKLIGEKMIHWAANRYQFNYVVFRYFNVAGASLDGNNGIAIGKPTHLMPNAVRALLGQQDELLVFGTDYDTIDGTCVRDYIHVMDLARAHTMGMQYMFAGGKSDLFNLGTENGFSVKQIIDAVEEVSGQKLPHRLVERRPGDPASVLANCDKVRNILKWEPVYDLKTIIQTEIDWRTKHPRGYEN
jgi:UDP-glucose 4-epimerase